MLILLKSNERLWAICSDHSRKMSDYERIPQVEQMSNSLKKCCLKNLKSYFLVCFIKVFFFKKWSICSFPRFLVSNVSKSLRSLIKNELCERITLVPHQKWAMWGDRSGRSPKWANERIAFFKEQIARLFIFSHKKGNSLRKSGDFVSYFYILILIRSFQKFCQL